VILTGGEAEGSGSPLRVSATQELHHHIVRVGCVSSRPAPLVAGELKVTGLKRANVGELFARLGFRQEAAYCETYFVGFEAARRSRAVRQRSMRLGRHDDSPVRDDQK
jgi:hypothetical protein